MPRHSQDGGRTLLAPLRRQRILDVLATGAAVSTDQLRQEVGASIATVRRDLALLERRGHLLRIHGGAVLLRPEPRPALPAEAIRQLEAALDTLRDADLPHAVDCLRAALEQWRTNVTYLLPRGY